MAGPANAHEPRELAPAVKSGAFSYEPSSGLTVNGIARCHQTRLLEHLAFVDPGPALTKKGKPRVRQPPRPKDESVEFYRAQMVHYGLATAKTSTVSREAAKEALSATTLQVPKSVQDVEMKLKALYDAQMEADATDSGLSESKKRQRDDGEESGTSGSKSHDDPAAKRAKQAEIKPQAPVKRKGIDLDTVCGSYNIQAKVKTLDSGDDYIDYEFSLKLALSPGRSHLWGSFDFCVISGVLRVGGVVWEDTANFHWCGNDNQICEYEYGPENEGFIQFLPGGKIKGHIEGELLGNGDGDAIEFTGSLCPGTAPTSTDEVREWMQDYRSLYSSNFDPDGSRWGKHGTSHKPAEVIESDTEDEGYGSSDSDELYGYRGTCCAFDDDDF